MFPIVIAGCGKTEKDAPVVPTNTGPYRIAQVSNGGSITGKITVTGDVAAARATIPMRYVTNGQEECCVNGHKDKAQQKLLGNGNALQNAVVWIVRCDSGKAPAYGEAELDQKGCDFVPHVVAVMRGDSVTMRNSDPVVHSIHGYKGIRTIFNIATPMAGMAYHAPCADTGMISCLCDAGHVWMSAFIHVLPNPYFAVTGEDGSFSIDNVPPGPYTVRIAHELWPTQERQVTVTGGSATSCDASFDLAHSLPLK